MSTYAAAWVCTGVAARDVIWHISCFYRGRQTERRGPVGKREQEI
jgi:hypothetical protein